MYKYEYKYVCTYTGIRAGLYIGDLNFAERDVEFVAISGSKSGKSPFVSYKPALIRVLAVRDTKYHNKE